MQEFILSHGSYLAIIAVLAFAGAGLPLPEEVPVVAAGVLSSVGKLDPTLAFLSCVVGALLGDCVMYGIGLFLGTTYLHRHPLFATIMHEEREKQMETLIQAHGMKVFLLARFLVGVRSPIYLAAGIMRVKFRRFLLMDAICASVVVGTFFSLSYFFGAWVGPLFRDSQLVATAIVLGIAAISGVYYFAWKRCWSRLCRGPSEPASDPEAASKAEPASEPKTETPLPLASDLDVDPPQSVVDSV